VTILPFGDRALLTEVAGSDEVLPLHAGLAASRPDGVVDIVPAARTVLVRIDPRALPLDVARAWIERVAGAGTGDAAAPADATTIELDIVYDGPDLADTAALLGVSAEALVARHRETVWTVAFTGSRQGSDISPATTGRSTCRASTPRARAFQSARWGSRGRTAERIRGPRPVDGA